MSSKGYGYQYETSPRKIEHEYDIPKKKRKTVKNKAPKVKIKSEKFKEKQKAKDLQVAKHNFELIMIFAIICILCVMYRTVKINERFAEVQSLTKQAAEIEKVNSQIAVNVQNSMNLSTIESLAMTNLGMQKLSNKQTVYITLDKKDYVESNVKHDEKQDEGFINKIIDKISDIF